MIALSDDNVCMFQDLKKQEKEKLWNEIDKINKGLMDIEDLEVDADLEVSDDIQKLKEKFAAIIEWRMKKRIKKDLKVPIL